MFGTGTDEVNLKSGLEECSHDLINVLPGIGDEHEVATGVIEVSMDITYENNDSAAHRNAVTAAVQDQLGHSLPGEYDYVLYSLEDCYDGCGWAAYAYINSWLSVYRKEYYKRPGVLMHEVSTIVACVFLFFSDCASHLTSFPEIYYYLFSLDTTSVLPTQEVWMGKLTPITPVPWEIHTTLMMDFSASTLPRTFSSTGITKAKLPSILALVGSPRQ